MGLADDLYDIGLKLDELKALKPDKEFSVQNRENNVGAYFIVILDGIKIYKSSVAEIVDILNALITQYENE